MAKKSRRTRRQARAPRLSAAQLVQPDEGGRQPEPGPLAQSTKHQPSDLGEEYRYVTTDLKRIAIIAAIMLVLMIVVTVILI